MTENNQAQVMDALIVKELKGVKFAMDTKAPQAMTSGANQAECPAGGVGAAAGGWDTADHRDEAILLINEIRSTLIANGMMKGAA